MAWGSLRKSHLRFTIAVLNGILVELHKSLLNITDCFSLSMKKLADWFYKENTVVRERGWRIWKSKMSISGDSWIISLTL